MYLDLGQCGAVRMKEIIGIFDMDTATAGRATRASLQAAQAEGRLLEARGELPRSAVLCGRPVREPADNRIYITSASPRALARRAAGGKKGAIA